MLKRFNAPVVVNSDAHYPTLLNSGRMEALKLLSISKEEVLKHIEFRGLEEKAVRLIRAEA